MNLFLSPLWLIALPLACAPVVFVVRRRERLACLLAASSTSITVRLCLSMPFDWSIDVLGRIVSLPSPVRVFLACISSWQRSTLFALPLSLKAVLFPISSW